MVTNCRCAITYMVERSRVHYASKVGLRWAVNLNRQSGVSYPVLTKQVTE